ncbi:hypothetical protein SPX_35080 [Sporomusa paucivorans]
MSNQIKGEIADISLQSRLFSPNRKYNFLKSRIRAASTCAVAKGSAQAVFSLKFYHTLVTPVTLRPLPGKAFHRRKAGRYSVKNPYSASVVLQPLFHKPADSFQGCGQVVDGGSIGAADKAFTAFTKGIAGDYGDFFRF